MGKGEFKVVIVGGAIAGLTLANILEKLGINFVLLEARSDIAPQEGASIGLLPHGLRVLDQLGIYEPIRKSNDKRLNVVSIRANNQLLLKYYGHDSQLQKRTGYGTIFLNRQDFLRALYGNLREKSRILLEKKVVEITQTKSGARVLTQDGATFEGDIVVGADGIHSAVRKEMWRIASELSPGHFPLDELKRVPIYYRTLFGISQGNSFPADSFSVMWHKDRSYLVVGGAEGRVYWFLFDRLPKPVYEDQCPRYSKEDELPLVEKFRDDVINDELVFGDLYDSSVLSGLTALSEWVFEKWHFGRMITIGDSSHKTNPNLGQGGNGAIESAAALANAITRKLNARSGSLADSDIDEAFRETQEVRQERARLFVEESHNAQKLNSMETVLHQFLGGVLPPILTRDMRDAQQIGMLEGAVKVEGLPVPNRPHVLPFVDELPETPLKSAWLPRSITAVILLVLFYLANQAIAGDAVPSSFRGLPFKTVYTGLEKIDEMISLLVKVFSVVVATEDQAYRLQVAYLLAMLSSTVLIWTVEANRRGNYQTFTGRLLIWPAWIAVLYQTLSIAKVGPIYCLVTLFTSNEPIYRRTTGRNVEPAVAQALLPALLIGYGAPTFLMFNPLNFEADAWQFMIGLWQFAPVFTSPLTSLIASLIRLASPSRDEDPHELRDLDNTDVPYLRSAYVTLASALAVIHIGTATHIANSLTMTLRGVFLGLPSLFQERPSLGPEKQVSNLFKYDLVFYVLVLLVWCFYTVFEMRRLGYVRTREAVIAAVCVPVSLVVVGPGAMHAGVWYWRENVISGLSDQ